MSKKNLGTEELDLKWRLIKYKNLTKIWQILNTKHLDYEILSLEFSKTQCLNQQNPGQNQTIFGFKVKKLDIEANNLDQHIGN